MQVFFKNITNIKQLNEILLKHIEHKESNFKIDYDKKIGEDFYIKDNNVSVESKEIFR